jgi:hypothetical protein
VKGSRIAALFLAGGFGFGFAAATTREVLPWVDDFAKAASQARATNVPIFVEAWAPW